MKTRRRSIFAAAATLLAVLMGVVTATGMAQTPPPAPARMSRHHQDMNGMQDMRGMMVGPHHVLAMAYRDNLATFARALRSQLAQSKVMDLDLARPAVAEMRRSFDQMQQHHQAQMTMMASHPDSSMSGAMQRMEAHLTALGDHLAALESEVNASTPDPEKVSEHTTEIMKECAGMSAMPAKAKLDQMK
jgi:hypothetical protein